MLKNTKIYGVILGVVLFILLITGLTYAYITWQSSNIGFNIESDCFIINYINGQNISNSDLYVINEEDFLDGNYITIVDGMELTTVSLDMDSSCGVTGTGTIKLNVSTLSNAFVTNVGDSVGALKYKVVEYSSDTYPTVTTDALSGTVFTIIKEGTVTSTGSIDLHSMQINNSSTREYIIIFYLDEVLIQNDAVGASFYGTISAEVIQNG